MGKIGKKIYIKDVVTKIYNVIDKNKLVQAIRKTKQISIQPLNPKLKIDLSEILNENLLREQLIRHIYKFAKSVTEMSNKVRETKICNKAINDFIYSNR